MVEVVVVVSVLLLVSNRKGIPPITSFTPEIPKSLFQADLA